jgi:hypothetical protein
LAPSVAPSSPALRFLGAAVAMVAAAFVGDILVVL